jgi:hypothetical protein
MSAPAVSKKRKVVADGVFYAEVGVAQSTEAGARMAARATLSVLAAVLLVCAAERAAHP